MTDGHWYRGHGLLIHSEITLPEYTPAETGAPDVEIRLSDLPRDVLAREAETREIPHRAILRTGQGALFHFPEVGTFLVQEGRAVHVAPIPDHDPGLLRLVLLGSIMGMLFHQRGRLVLHGSAVVQPGGISVFVGDSGAGKSTLAAHLGARGFAVLADDTLATDRCAAGGYEAWPGSRVFKLWDDALAGLGADPAGLDRVITRERKFFFGNVQPAQQRAVPLAEVVLLERGDGPPTLSPLPAIDALGMITAHVYRPEYVALLDRREDHFEAAAQLAGTVRAYQLTRPWEIAAMPAVLDLLARHWGTG